MVQSAGNFSVKTVSGWILMTVCSYTHFITEGSTFKLTDNSTFILAQVNSVLKQKRPENILIDATKVFIIVLFAWQYNLSQKNI